MNLHYTYNYSDFSFTPNCKLATYKNAEESWIGYWDNGLHNLLKRDRTFGLMGGDMENIIIQDLMSSILGNKNTNWIKIYNTQQKKFIQSFNSQIFLLYGKNIGNYFLAKEEFDEKVMLHFFNPFTRETSWKTEITGMMNIKYIDQDKIIVTSNELLINCYSTNGILLWQYDTSHLYIEDLFIRKEIPSIKYLKNLNLFIVYAQPPSRIFALDVSTGKLVWETEKHVNDQDFMIDESTGLIYCLYKKHYPEYLDYQVFDGKTGKNILQNNILEQFPFENNRLNLCYGQLFGDFIYLDDYRTLYKLDKKDGSVVDTFTNQTILDQGVISIYENWGFHIERMPGTEGKRLIVLNLE
jgi:outer membrane protein assembly factor BamB